MASLTVIRGPDRGRRVELTGARTAIGRDANNALQLHDSEASRRHAELERTATGFVVRDLESSNGTVVNGAAVKFVALSTGDQIRIGQTEMVFTGDAAAAPADLSRRIRLLEGESADNSAIVSSIAYGEGTQFLRHPEKAGSEWLRNALAHLTVMYEASSAVSRIADVDRLLARLLELIFESIEADRGCVVLLDAGSGEPRPAAVRYRDGAFGAGAGGDGAEGVGASGDGADIELPRSIIDWVLQREEGVTFLDAADDRFGGAESVSRLGIREAICVPLRGRRETLGVLYVDVTAADRSVLRTQRPTRLGDDQLKLMIAIAYQAGVALEDNRYYQAMLEAERLAGVGQTIATISHHVKNILQGLRSGSYVVDRGLAQGKLESAAAGWDIVKKNQERLYGLVLDMPVLLQGPRAGAGADRRPRALA